MNFVYICYYVNELCLLLNVSPPNCVFFHKLNADCVFYPAVTGQLTSARSSLMWLLVATPGRHQYARHYCVPSSDGRMMSSYPSLLGSTVATDDFCLLLLCYHCSNILVATVRMPVATVNYDMFLQWCVVVVL
jgi:hypothetical protein